VGTSATGPAPTLRSPSSPLPPPPAPSPPPAEHPLAGTAKLDARALFQPALPFAEPPRSTSPLADTLEVGASLPLPATPFEPKP
jgi:hypothetical protein